MYFQWIPGGDSSAADAERRASSLRAVKRLVKEANDYAQGAGPFRTSWMWAFTPTPFPTTPPPAGCPVGEVPVNPYSNLKVKYSALAHGTTETVQCPEEDRGIPYTGTVTIGCDHGAATARCFDTPWVEGEGKVSCCLAGCRAQEWVVYPWIKPPGKVMVPKMMHDTKIDVTCPAGYTGSVKFGCNNGGE